MHIEYLCRSWQDLLEVVKRLVSKEYYFYTIQYLPKNKEDKFKKIDEKLINKYQAFYQKDIYHRRKKHGLANFRYLRWEHVVVILHTDGDILTSEDIKQQKHLQKVNKVKPILINGKINKGLLERFKEQKIYKLCIDYDDRFNDVRIKPIFLKISEMVSFCVQFETLVNPRKKLKKIQQELASLETIKEKQEKIKLLEPSKRSEKQRQLMKKDIDSMLLVKRKQEEKYTMLATDDSGKRSGVTVRLSKIFMQGKKAELADHAEHRRKNKLIYSFEMLNQFPPHRGILNQQWEMQRFCLLLAKKHNFALAAGEILPKNRSAVPQNRLFHTIDVRRYEL